MSYFLVDANVSFLQAEYIYYIFYKVSIICASNIYCRPTVSQVLLPALGIKGE